MPRFVLAALAMATLALPGARAAADDCMCLGPETLFPAASIAPSAELDAAQLDAAQLDAAHLDAAHLDAAHSDEVVLESPDDTIETIDPTAPQPEVAPAPERARGPVAWCRSADDPRCQRDDAHETSHREMLRDARLATTLTTPVVPRAPFTRVQFPRTVTTGPTGVAFRLDRPPRV